MTETETDAEFLKEMAKYAGYFTQFITRDDWDRLLRLAERGVKIPDEPTEAMIEAAKDYAPELPMNDAEATDIWLGMLTTALKDTDND